MPTRPRHGIKDCFEEQSLSVNLKSGEWTLTLANVTVVGGYVEAAHWCSRFATIRDLLEPAAPDGKTTMLVTEGPHPYEDIS